MLRTRNNTDGNKLVIFYGIASYYGDNYIVANLSIEMILTQPVVIYCEFTVLLYTHVYITIGTNTCIFICLVKDH